MADTIVAHVVSQLANLLIQEAAFLRGVRDQVEWVKTELQRMKGFLKDAESRRRRGNERVENWIREIRDVAYEVEDIIDRFMFMVERQRQRRGFMGTISRYSHKPCELFTLHKIGSEIEQIKEKIRGISDSRATYGIANLGESSAVDESLQSLRESSPCFDDDELDVIGFENDKKELVSQLLDGNEKARCVISIVGMGGLGKTTLARKVYKEITKHFDTFAWVSVSQGYRGIGLVKEIMEKVMGIKKEELEQMGEEEVREKLRDFLRDRKYLVVMDDVWSVDVWRETQRVFPGENKGSRILLTTREMEVANRARSSFPPYKLHPLNDTQSLELLCRKACPSKQDVPTDLKELAWRLAKRCGGLPLALVALGGLLSGKDPNYDAWWSVVQSMNWEDSGDGQQCFNILALSYNGLLHQLKPCFLFIAAFPEDSIISASKLVRLWVAEGFIPQEQTRTMEETARVWLDNLVQRCMIQVVERSKAHGRVKSIRIHDMLRDFGLSEARRDGFLYVCSSDNMAVSDGISSRRAAFHNRINDRRCRYLTTSPHSAGLQFSFERQYCCGKISEWVKFIMGAGVGGRKIFGGVTETDGQHDSSTIPGIEKDWFEETAILHPTSPESADSRCERYRFLSAPNIGDHKNLQTLRITIPRFFPDLWDIILFYIIRFIKNWVTRPGFTVEAMERTCGRMIGKPLGKSLEKMDSLVSFTLHCSPIPGDVLFTRAPNLHQLDSLILYGWLLLK